MIPTISIPGTFAPQGAGPGQPPGVAPTTQPQQLQQSGGAFTTQGIAVVQRGKIVDGVYRVLALNFEYKLSAKGFDMVMCDMEIHSTLHGLAAVQDPTTGDSIGVAGLKYTNYIIVTTEDKRRQEIVALLSALGISPVINAPSTKAAAEYIAQVLNDKIRNKTFLTNLRCSERLLTEPLTAEEKKAGARVGKAITDDAGKAVVDSYTINQGSIVANSVQAIVGR